MEAHCSQHVSLGVRRWKSPQQKETCGGFISHSTCLELLWAVCSLIGDTCSFGAVLWQTVADSKRTANVIVCEDGWACPWWGGSLFMLLPNASPALQLACLINACCRSACTLSLINATKCPSEFWQVLRKPLKSLKQKPLNCACLRRGAWEEMVHCRARTCSLKTICLSPPKPPPPFLSHLPFPPSHLSPFSRIWSCSSASWSPGWSPTFPKPSLSSWNGRRSSWSRSSYKKRRKNSSSSGAFSPRTPPSNPVARCSTGVRAPLSRAATVLFLQVQHRAWGRGWGVGRPASASSPGTPRRCPQTKMRIQNTRRCDRTHL